MNGHYEYERAAFVSARMLVGQFLAGEYLKQMKQACRMDVLLHAACCKSKSLGRANGQANCCR